MTGEKLGKQKKKTSGEVFTMTHRRRVQNFTVRVEKMSWTLAGEQFSVV